MRYCGGAFDYRIGRTMFESSSIPAEWLEHTDAVDELWVSVAVPGGFQGDEISFIFTNHFLYML